MSRLKYIGPVCLMGPWIHARTHVSHTQQQYLHSNRRLIIILGQFLWHCCLGIVVGRDFVQCPCNVL